MSGKAAPRVLTATVVADSADKTVRVRVERHTQHPLYGKVMRRHSHYLAHDEGNACKAGDVVRIQECPRVSKRKSWRVLGAAGGEAQ